MTDPIRREQVERAIVAARVGTVYLSDFLGPGINWSLHAPDYVCRLWISPPRPPQAEHIAALTRWRDELVAAETPRAALLPDDDLAMAIERKMRALEGSIHDQARLLEARERLLEARPRGPAPEITPADPERPTVAVPRDLVEAIVADLREGLVLERETGEALAKLLDATPTPQPHEPQDDTRDWYWRADDGETRPEGPYPTREAALADVLGHYAVGELPERVLVGRCTDPLSLVTLDAEDVREMLRDRLMDIADMDVSIHDESRADDALDAWVREYVVCEWEWVTDPDEEWVELNPEGGAS